MLVHLRLNLHNAIETPYYNIFTVGSDPYNITWGNLASETQFPYIRSVADQEFYFESTKENLEKAAKQLYRAGWAYQTTALVDQGGIEVWHEDYSRVDRYDSVQLLVESMSQAIDKRETIHSELDQDQEEPPLTAEELDHIVIYIKARRLAAHYGGYLYNEARFTDTKNAVLWQQDMGESIKQFSPDEFTKGDSQNDPT